MPEPLDLSPEFTTWLAAAELSIKPSYRVDEVARLLRISERTVYYMIRRGDLDSVRITGRGYSGKVPTRIPICSLLSLLD